MEARVKVVPKVDIEKYIQLYKKGYSIHDIKPVKNGDTYDQTYEVFANSKFDIRVVHRDLAYEDPMAFQRIDYFLVKNEYFYMVPMLTVKETIVGFILRGVFRKDYSTVYREFTDTRLRVPVMFGFDKSFAKLDEKSECYPLVICEGCKDCMVLKRFYPYVLANNTSSMGLNADILSNISNKFLLAYDNDDAGRDGMIRDKRILRNKGLIVDSLDIRGSFKDCADHIRSPREFRDLIKQMKRKLKMMYEFDKV